LALRRSVRAQFILTLSLPLELLANAIPALGEAADVIAIAQLAGTFREFQQLDIDTKAALDFLTNGPYSLEDLRVSADSEAFSSYGAFKKDALYEAVEEWLLKRFGSAGDGYQYHHIVEQGGANADGLPAQQLQSTDNIVRIPTLLHEAVSSRYSSKSRQEMQTKSFYEQRDKGVEVMRDLGIIR